MHPVTPVLAVVFVAIVVTTFVVGDHDGKPGFDGSFTDGTRGWSTEDGAHLSRLSGGPHGIEHFGRVDVVTGDHPAIVGAVAGIPATKAGHAYRLTLWLRASDPGELLAARIAEQSDSGYPRGQSERALPTGSTGWRELTVRYVAQATGSRLRVDVIGMRGSSTDHYDLTGVTLDGGDAGGQGGTKAGASPSAGGHSTDGQAAAGGHCDTVDADLVPACGAWWGAYSTAGKHGDPTAALTGLEREVGRTFDIVVRYHDFSTAAGRGVFPDASERRLGDSRMLYLNWESRDFSTGATYDWQDIADGRYDQRFLIPEARRIRDYGKKVFVSFDPEMDRQSGRQGYKYGDAKQYVAAARHVHDVFAKQGVHNVVWVWTTTGYLGAGNDDRIKRMYPGDDYVDWVGYDPYNFYKCNGAGWETFDQSVGGTYEWLEANGFGDKPFMLPEYGTQYDPGAPDASTQWYYDMPGALTKRYPDIKGLLRWDSGANCKLNVDSGPGMRTAFAQVGMAPYVNQPLPRR